MITLISDIIMHREDDVYGKFNIVYKKQPYEIEGVLLKQAGAIGELLLAIGTPEGIITDLECTIVSVREIKHDNLEEYKKTLNTQKKLTLGLRKPYYLIHKGYTDLYVLINKSYISIRNYEILPKFKIKHEISAQIETHKRIVELLDKLKDTNTYEENLVQFEKIGSMLDIVTPIHINNLYKQLGETVSGNGLLTLRVPFATKAWVTANGIEAVGEVINDKVKELIDTMFRVHKLKLVKEMNIEQDNDNYVAVLSISFSDVGKMTISVAQKYVLSLKTHTNGVLEEANNTRHKMR